MQRVGECGVLCVGVLALVWAYSILARLPSLSTTTSEHGRWNAVGGNAQKDTDDRPPEDTSADALQRPWISALDRPSAEVELGTYESVDRRTADEVGRLLRPGSPLAAIEVGEDWFYFATHAAPGGAIYPSAADFEHGVEKENRDEDSSGVGGQEQDHSRDGGASESAASNTASRTLLRVMRYWTERAFGSELVEIAEAGAAPYDECHKKTGQIAWLVLRGHFRSFRQKLPNFTSFIRSAKCLVVLLYTMPTAEASGGAWWAQNRGENAKMDLAGKSSTVEHEQDKKLDVGKWLRKMVGTSSEEKLFRTNFAYVIEKRRVDTPHVMHMAGWAFLMEAVRKYVYKIPVDMTSAGVLRAPPAPGTADSTRAPQHVIALSRPDLLFSHNLNWTSLFELEESYARVNRGFAILTPHDAGKAGGWDPSELFGVGNRFYWLRMVTKQVRQKLQSRRSHTKITAGLQTLSEVVSTILLIVVMLLQID